MLKTLQELWIGAEHLLIVILLTFWAGVTRTIFVVKKRTLGAYLASVFISIPAGTLAVHVFQEMGLSFYLSTTLGVAVGIVAHDVIEALLLVFSNKAAIAAWIAKKLGLKNK